LFCEIIKFTVWLMQLCVSFVNRRFFKPFGPKSSPLAISTTCEALKSKEYLVLIFNA
jgi:hypothetical protein